MARLSKKVEILTRNSTRDKDGQVNDECANLTGKHNNPKSCAQLITELQYTLWKADETKRVSRQIHSHIWRFLKPLSEKIEQAVQNQTKLDLKNKINQLDLLDI